MVRRLSVTIAGMLAVVVVEASVGTSHVKHAKHLWGRRAPAGRHPQADNGDGYPENLEDGTLLHEQDDVHQYGHDASARFRSSNRT
jgi:hypothetical protein